MDVSPELEEKIARLQMLEQNVQAFSSQRQQFQIHITEIEHALQELEHTKEKPYKIVGSLMIASDAEELKKELSSQKEMAELRIKSLEKQETQLREKAESLQKEVVGALQQKGGK